jgi:tRNA dimethylallyltransferase
LIVIGGATATGKTDLAIRLAQHFETEIVSADSRQFYQEISIGVAKPSEAELAAVKHHFINSLSVTKAYSVGDFEKQALAVLDSVFKTKNVAVMVGGSGLFINAVCQGLDTFPEVPETVRQSVEIDYQKSGIGALQEELKKCDPAYFATVDVQNPARLVRAIAVFRASGKPFSGFLKRTKNSRSFHPIYVLLDLPRAELYDRINLRIEKMMETGLLDEVKKMLPFRENQALQTVGYAELFDHLDGKYSLETAVEKIKQHTRNYAKRQVTWFKKHGDWTSFSPDQKVEIVNWIETQISKSTN